MASNSRSWLTPQPSLVGKQQVALLQQAAMLLHTGARTVRRRRRLWYVLAALALLTAGALLLSRRAAEPRYVLVIDAGSSGTRMYAYTWRKGLGGGGAAPLLAGVPSSAAPHKVPRRAMPSKRAYQRVETEPGLDHYKDDAEGLQAQALGPLLEWAEAVVPRRQWAQTPVFLFGTAGLRKLSEGQQGVLLAGVRGVLQRSAFRFLPAWARIISGTDEGVYGWVALNYLEGRLRAGSDTLGALDLGGSSLEVTFAADSVPWREDAVNSTVLGAVHQLYSHVHHHYGLNDAFDRSVTILLARQLASGSVRGAASKQGSQRQQAQLGGALLPHSDDAATDKLTSSRTASDSRRAAEKAGVMASSIGLATTGQAAADASFNADTRADDSTQGQRRLQAPQALLRRLLVTGDTPGSGSAVGAEQQQEQQQGAHRGLLAEVLEEVQHPCLHDGFRQVYTRLAQEGSGGLAPLRVMLVGRSDYEACQQLALAVVDASVPCSAPPCALGTPQPSTVGHRFVALTGFFVVYRFFRLPHNASVDALEEAGRHFCAKSWLQVQQERGGELMLENYCFRAPYIASLVTHGLQLNGKQLQVGGGEVGWTLGAALAEGYRLAGLSRIRNEAGFSWPSVGGRLVAMRILAAGSFVAVVYLIASWWRHRCSVPTRRNGIRITSKGSAELLHLSDGMDGSASSIPTGSDFSPPLISAGTPLKRTVGWAAAARPGGAVATQAGESSSARMHTQPWAGHDPAAGSAGSSGSAADAGLQRQRSHSNLNRLGRSRTFSRRSLAAASPDGEWLNSVVTS